MLTNYAIFLQKSLIKKLSLVACHPANFFLHNFEWIQGLP